MYKYKVNIHYIFLIIWLLNGGCISGFHKNKEIETKINSEIVFLKCRIDIT